MNPLTLLALAVFATADELTTVTETRTLFVTRYTPEELSSLLAASLPPALVASVSSASAASVDSASSASVASRQSVIYAPNASASRTSVTSMSGASALTTYNGVIALAWGLNFSQISNTSSTLQSRTAVTASTTASASYMPLTSRTLVGGAGTAGVAIGVLAAVAANLL